jgi:lipoprotein-releasing system permease protein
VSGKVLPDYPSEVRPPPGVSSVDPFIEIRGLIKGKRNNEKIAFVRAVEENILEYDIGMAAQLKFETGSFDITNANYILLGAELAHSLSVREGDSVNLISIANLLPGVQTNTESVNSENREFIVKGTFRTGFYEYDSGWAFINLYSGIDYTNKINLGIKIKNRYNDASYIGIIQNIINAAYTKDYISENNIKVSVWRDYNRAFFSALKTEKTFMFILVGIIFIVVAVNIFHGQRRAVAEKKEEISLMRAVGASEISVRLIFTSFGFLIGFAGSTIGIALALLITNNINFCFSALENVANFFIDIMNYLVNVLLPNAVYSEGFSFFSPAIFYIKEIPCRVIPIEAACIYLAGVLSAAISAFMASKRATTLNPAEVLRYE